MNDELIIKYIDNYMESFKPYKDGRWCYEDGILMNALYELYISTNNKKYYDFVYSFYDSCISDDGVIKNYSNLEYNIDNIASGIGLIKIYKESKNKKFKGALDSLFEQLKNHPRNSEGNYFHKKIYPYQVWLDGIYMGLVFYSEYIKLFNIESKIEDIDSQLKNVLKHMYNKKNNLFYHAYDELKVMQWADKETGLSPNVWSRSVGWLLMANVDIYEELKLDISKEILVKCINGLTPYLKDGMMMQVVNIDAKSNYTEVSGSAMYSYSVLKAKRLGIIDDDSLGVLAFDTIINTKFDGINLKDICRVAGLDNKNRDGSFEYYMSEEKAVNEVKGVAPFILAYSEIIRRK